MVRQSQTVYTHINVFCVCSGRRYIYKFYPLCNVLINKVFLFYFTEPPPNLNARGTRRGSGKYLLNGSVCYLSALPYSLSTNGAPKLTQRLANFLTSFRVYPDTVNLLTKEQKGKFLIPPPPQTSLILAELSIG